MSGKLKESTYHDGNISLTACFGSPTNGIYIILNKWNKDKTAICAHHLNLSKGEALRLAENILEHYKEQPHA